MRNWIFILIFSTLLGNMNAHQIQLVTYHQKTNGVLIRVVVSNVPEVDNIARLGRARKLVLLNIK